MCVLREYSAYARAGGIRCDVEELVEVGQPKNRGGRQRDFKLLEGAFGGWIPSELGLAEDVRQWSGDGDEIADEPSIKLS